MQAEVDVKCMKTKFGDHGLYSFRDIATSKIWQNFPLGSLTVHAGQQIELAQKIPASRD